MGLEGQILEKTGKRYPLNMRTTKHVRDLLEKAAKQSGRSLAQEVEHRLLSSFVLTDGRTGMPNTQTLDLLALLSACIKLVEEKKGTKWLDDPETYLEVAEAISRALKLLLPAVIQKNDLPSLAFEGGLRERLANIAIQDILNEHGTIPSDTDPDSDRVQRMKEAIDAAETITPDVLDKKEAI